jgi:hypothetical protein
LGIEQLAIVCAGAAGFAGLPWALAALAGAAVYLLSELNARDAPPLHRLAGWQMGPWRTIAGSAFIGAGHCCLGWGVGMGARMLFA